MGKQLTNETLIQVLNRVNTEIKKRAGQSDLDAIDARLDDVDAALGTKADKSDLTALGNTVSGHTTDISDMKSTLSSHATSISNLEDAIGDGVDSLREEIEGELESRDTAIGANASAIETLQQTTSSQGSSISDLETRMDNAENDIDDLNTALDGKASASDLTTLGGTVSDLSMTVGGHTTSITNLENTVGGHTTDISDIQSQISSIVSEMANVGNPVVDISQTITGDYRVDFADGTSKTFTIESGTAIKSVEYDTSDFTLHFYDADDQDLFTPVVIQGGGGGGTTVGSIKISYVTPSAMTCVYGNETEVHFGLLVKDADEETVGGSGTWTINGVVVERNIPYASADDNSFNVTSYLQPGENTVRLTISADVGGDTNLTRTKTWTLTAVRMYFEWDFNDAQVATGSFIDYWTVYGDIEKTTHTKLDGAEQETLVTARPSYTHNMRFSNLTHGTHTIERWLTATVNGEDQESPHQYHELICAIPGNDTPVISISMQMTTMNQYDTLAIPVVIYDPLNLTATATLSVNGEVVDTWENYDRTVHYWYYTPSEYGAKNLTVTCRGVSRSLILTVKKVEIDIEETSGYTFRFKASELTSNNAIRNWSSEGVSATFSDNFDWVNGGLQTEKDDNGNVQQYICIKAGTTMTINHSLFATDPKASGRTFKMIFKIARCRDYDAEFMHCVDSDNIGIRMYAHKAFFRSSGTTINVPYNEDEYIELEFDVYPNTDVSYMMAWLDGVITSCRVYGASDVFTQTNPEGIVIGSPDCDVHIYMVKAYPFRVSRDQHIDNFIMDAPNAAELVKRYNRNDILTDQKIDYAKLARQNPDCRVWLYEVPYITNDKGDKVKNCKFQQLWSNGDAYYQISGEGTMSIQGTSSVLYKRGAANTDINFTSLIDGNNKDLLEGATKDDAYGNNWYAGDPENAGTVKVYTVEEALAEAKVQTQDALGPEWVAVERNADAYRTPTKYIKAMGLKLNDDSCPISYSNTKVNFASCEQVNNMCNAEWYQRYNPYPSLTARDCMEFNMGVQFIMDHAQLPDDSHYALFDDDKRYYMYSIANMGTSKKNVHVFHDLSNAKEVCVEVKDNDKNQERMVNPDGLSKTDYFQNENWGGKVYYEMRYPDAEPTDEVKNAWYDFVWWMAESDPQQATGNALAAAETYEPYTFRGHDRGNGGILKGTTVSQYAGTYTHDTFERRMAKMLNECEDHMVMDSFIYHFLYLERHTMQDNVSKNNFWSSTDLVHWDLSKAYDMDTSDGNNNQGQLVFDYGNEFDDWQPGGANRVFNGGDSVWFVFCGNLYEALQVMFRDREIAGAWSASAYHKFLTDQQKKVPERCWVQCYWYDYLRTYEQNIEDDWITFLDGGQKTHQRKHYETYQEMYESSKFRGTVSTSNPINFRAYTPPYWGGVVTPSSGGRIRKSSSTTSSIIATVPKDEIVHILAKTDENWRQVSWGDYTGYMQISELDTLEPKGEITVTMYNKMYIAVDVGTSSLPLIKAERGVPYTVDFSYGGLTSNTVISVYTAQMVQALSGIEQLYPDTCNFSAGVRLREISVGSSKKGYSNPNLASLGLSNNILLEKLYVQNQPNANSVLDLSNCPSLVYLDATGSGFTGYNFANGGLIAEATLQKPTTLSLVNLQYLTDAKFTILDYSGLISLRHENTPGVDSLNMVTLAVNLRIARLLGIDWRLVNTAQLERLVVMQGLDENGYTTETSVLTGDAYTLVITQRNLDRFNEAWPNLNVTYPEEGMVPQYRITFLDEDGSDIIGVNHLPYVQYVDYGSTIYDPIEAGEVSTPTKEADSEYTYQFNGWDNIEGNITSDRTVTATYIGTKRTYTVRWFALPGMSALKTMNDVEYGADVAYDAADPLNYPEIQESYGTYRVFTGWDKSTGYITGNTDVYARWITGVKPSVGDKELHEMSAPEIYAIAQANEAATYWEPKDYIDIPMGHDFDFDNGDDPGCVKSQVIANELYLDGQASSMVDTGIKLFDPDTGDWTIAFDYEFGEATSGAVLASCFSTNDNVGFKLQYYDGYPSILWSDGRYNIGSGPHRGIVVLRHRRGSQDLYVACDNNSGTVYNFEIKASERTAARYNNFSKALIFGGTILDAGGVEDVSSGWIHWCKIWYADLGKTVIHQIANWTKETYRWEYDKPGRYLLQEGSSDYCAASFWMNQLAIKAGQMNSSNTNQGGWRDSMMRTFANERFYSALPYEWQCILATVRVKSSDGYGSAVVSYSENKIYLPAWTEVYNYSAEPYNTERSPGGLISYTSTANQTMFYGAYRPADSLYITYSGDPTSFSPSSDGHVNGTEGSGYYRNVKNGDMLVLSTNSNSRYIYVDAETSEKYSYLYLYAKSSCIAASAGGYWVPAPTYWTRSPYYYTSSSTVAQRYFRDITPGSYTYDSASGNRGLRFGFSL